MTRARAPVLVIDDDASARRLVRLILRADPLRIIEAATGVEGLSRASAERPEVILVEQALPDIDGIEIIEALRARSAAPILVVSNLTAEKDKVRALEAGADDYVTKPFGSAELRARVGAALRRSTRASGSAVGSVITVGDLRIDLARRQVFARGAEVH